MGLSTQVVSGDCRGTHMVPREGSLTEKVSQIHPGQAGLQDNDHSFGKLLQEKEFLVGKELAGNDRKGN